MKKLFSELYAYKEGFNIQKANFSDVIGTNDL